MQQEGSNWREILKESSWVTIAWEWFQTLLGRAVDLVLWITMVFSCYQLIPGAPQVSPGISTFMFIMQFIALDVGGLAMNQLAQRQGLPRWAYARIIAYILIGITLITISYAGVQHAVKISPDVTNWIEVVLVVGRSIMTVLYGQAMRSLKEVDVTMRDHLAELEIEAPVLREQVSSVQYQLSSVQSQVSTLRQQLDGAKQEVSTLRQQLDTEKRHAAEIQNELQTGHGNTAALRRELNTALVQVETLQAQLEGKKQELAGLRETLESGQEWQESRVRGVLETEQQRVSNLQEQFSGEQAASMQLRKQLNAMEVDVDGLRTQLNAREREVERFQQALEAEQQIASSLKQALETEQQQVSTLRQKLDNEQALRASTGQVLQASSGQGKVVRLDTSRSRKSGPDETGIAEQIRTLMAGEPGISGRQIAVRLGCSPTTAAKWKQFFEENGGQRATECANE